MANKPFIDILEEYPDVDQFEVFKKDENYHYVWANKKPDNVERMKNIFGYEVVGPKSNETAMVAPNAAGERVNGDVILMRMPIERYERLQRMKRQRNESRITAANDAWRSEVEKSGLKTSDTTQRTQSSSLLSDS